MYSDTDPSRARRSYALCFWFGAYLVDRGVVTFPAVLKTFFAVVMSAMGVGQASGLAPDAQKAQLSTRSIFQLLDTVPSIDADSEAGTGFLAPRILFWRKHTGVLEFCFCFAAPTRSIVPLLSRPCRVPHHPGSPAALENADVEFENVGFAYATRPDGPVFRSVSFKVRAGQKVALVGPSGGGKSTAIAMLLRFYNPDTGMQMPFRMFSVPTTCRFAVA